jgi:surface antigen
MTTRAILVAATTFAAGLSAPSAEALAPWAMDDSMASPPPEGPSEYATAAPRAFERPPESAFEPNPVVADRRARLQCVPFVRRETGVEIYGNANTWWTQARERYERVHAPAEGAVAVLRGYASANRGHVAVVREIISERMIIVDHANWLNTGEITRDVPVRDVSPQGDWSQVQVWHVPGGHWGARTYNVQGFILNVARQVKAEAASAPAG